MILYIYKVHQVIIVITIYVSFCINIEFANFTFISRKTLVGPVGNMHDLNITLLMSQ